MCVVIGQGHIWPCHGQSQTHWSHLRPGVQSICLFFVSWQSDHFWLRYSKFHIWPWKFKVKFMAKFKPEGHIWGLKFNRYVCFSFYRKGTIFRWDIANFIFDLENSRSRSWRKSTKMWSSNLIGQKKIQKVVQKLLHELNKLCGRQWQRTKRCKTIKSTPIYWGDLITKLKWLYQWWDYNLPKSQTNYKYHQTHFTISPSFHTGSSSRIKYSCGWKFVK